MSAKEKCIYPNLRRYPKNKTFAKQIFYYQFHTLNTKHTKHILFYLPVPIGVTLSIFTFSAFMYLTLTPNIAVLLTAIPLHTILNPIHCRGQTALLKSLCTHSQWDVLLNICMWSVKYWDCLCITQSGNTADSPFKWRVGKRLVDF
jgi:hypothetical protein